jgi:hypothetical protein
LRLSKIFILVGILLVFVSSVLGDPASSEPVRSLPDKIGKYRRLNIAYKNAVVPYEPDWNSTGRLSAIAFDEAVYEGIDGSRVIVGIARYRQDAEAYEVLSLIANQLRKYQPNLEIVNNIGTAGFAGDGEIGFFRGTSFVRMQTVTGKPNLDELSQILSQTLDKGEDDIPVLIKHLPSAEEAKKKAVYWNSFPNLDEFGLEQPVLSAVESGGNADAVLAGYGPSKLLIIEFNTPQLASENDRRIIARIQELWKLGHPAPTAYRRVGNYSVFVFDAPDEQTAKQLIDQVKYEQVVQWLGENPNVNKEAERRYINTTLGVLVAVLKASGYAVIACLGLGGLIGALLFSYRRAQQKAVTFSDAGGMLRLNLDDLTAQSDPGRLLRERN